jgi:hypothetical protein
MISMLLVYPIHKLLHCLPVWLIGKKAYLTLKFEDKRLPLIYCKYPKALPKGISLVATLSPALFITSVSITGSLLFPAYIPLFSIFSTLNIALCTTDAIYVFHLWNAPRSSYFEDEHNIFHILTKEMN